MKGRGYGVLGLTLVLFVTSHAFRSEKSAVVSCKWRTKLGVLECYAARQTVFYSRRNISLLFWVTSVVLSPRIFHFHLAHQVLSHQRFELMSSWFGEWCCNQGSREAFQSFSFLLAHYPVRKLCDFKRKNMLIYIQLLMWLNWKSSRSSFKKWQQNE